MTISGPAFGAETISDPPVSDDQPPACICPAAPMEEQAVSQDPLPAGAAPETPDLPAADIPLLSDAAATGRRKIYFSELLPDPIGRDTDGEFIEIANTGDEEAALDGWRIESASGKIFDIPTTVIAPRGYYHFIYAETKIALTNSGADLLLRDESGETVDSVSYSGPAKEGQSYAKNESGGWQWTPHVTAGRSNEFPLQKTEETAMIPEIDEVVEDDIVPFESVATNVISADAGDPDGAAEKNGVGTEAIVVISEFMPDPAGDDGGEWIELANLGDIDAGLAGWSVDDEPGGSKPYVLTAADTVPARGYLLLPRSKTGIALNNGGDTARLLDPNGQTVEAIRYSQAPEGHSFEKTPLGWRWSEKPTPGSANNIEIIDNQAEKLIPTVTAGVAEITAEINGVDAAENEPLTDIGDLPELEDGAEVTVVGVVNIPRGRLAKTLVGLQNENGTAGIIARLYGSQLPEMTAGEMWTIRGRLSRINSEPRLNTSVSKMTSAGRRQIAYQSRTVADIDDFDAGRAVSVAGTVVGSGGNWLVIADENGEQEIRAVLPKGISPGSPESGVRVTAAGVIRFVKDRPELVIMARNDIKYGARPEQENAGTDDPAAEQGAVPAVGRPPLVLAPEMEKLPFYAACGSAAALASAASGLAFLWWKKRRCATGQDC